MLTFRWIKISPFLILMLQFTVFSAAQTSRNVSFITLKVGDEVTLPCESVNKSQRGCASWIFCASSTDTKQLTSNGQIGEKARNKSDRLSVTADCSLVIKNFTAEDVGQYTCKSEEVQRQDGTVTVDLSVINMTEQQNNDKVILTCSVAGYDQCTHTVEWLYEGKQKTSSDMVMSPRACSATVTFITSQFNQKSNFYQSLTCKVINQVTKKEQLFPFKCEASCDETDTKKLNPTVTLIKETLTTPLKPTSSSSSRESGLIWCFIVPVGLATLLITATVIIRRKKTKRAKTQLDENILLSLNPTDTQSVPVTNQDTAKTEDGVSYISISFIKKTKNKKQPCGDVEDDTMTYSLVKAPSSSAGVSTDPSNLYSTVNNPEKPDVAH